MALWWARPTGCPLKDGSACQTQTDGLPSAQVLSCGLQTFGTNTQSPQTGLETQVEDYIIGPVSQRLSSFSFFFFLRWKCANFSSVSKKRWERSNSLKKTTISVTRRCIILVGLLSSRVTPVSMTLGSLSSTLHGPSTRGDQSELQFSRLKKKLQYSKLVIWTDPECLDW